MFWSNILSYQKQPPEVFCKKGVLENFAKFTRKHLCLSMLFNKIAGLKKRPWNKCFPVNFAKFLRTPLLRNTSGRPLLSYGCFLVFFLILRSGTEIYWDIVLLNICGELPFTFPYHGRHLITYHFPSSSIYISANLCNTIKQYCNLSLTSSQQPLFETLWSEVTWLSLFWFIYVTTSKWCSGFNMILVWSARKLT